MESLFTFGLVVFMGFFAIMNPFANLAVFLGLTEGDDKKTAQMIAKKALFGAFLITFVFIFSGNVIFKMFGISLPAFRIAGGILVFIIGFHMLQGEPSIVHTPNKEDQEKSLDAKLSIAISPLAIPILAGPGVIATAMSYAADVSFVKLLIIVFAYGLICLITYYVFVSGEKFIQHIGENAVKAITRLMGMILAVIGIQMLITGIHGAIKLFS